MLILQNKIICSLINDRFTFEIESPISNWGPLGMDILLIADPG